MGGLLCKQRSRSRPQHSTQSRRKKPHRVDCLLRGPCLLCFIVHGEHPATEAASPDVPAAQDCARLLLLCPGELSAWQERRLCGGLHRGPGLPCTAPSPQPADTMVCKRKNSGENPQPLTPCKQPRCTPARGQTHPHCEGLAPCPGGSTSPSSTGNVHPHCEDPSASCAGDYVHPNCEDPSASCAGDYVHPHCEDPSASCAGDYVHPHCEDPLCPRAENLTHNCEERPPCPGGDNGNHPTGDPSPSSTGEIAHPYGRDPSMSPGGETGHHQSGVPTLFPAEGKTQHSEAMPCPGVKMVVHSSEEQAHPLSGGHHSLTEVLTPSSPHSKLLTGDPSLACTKHHGHSVSGSVSHHAAEEKPLQSSSGDLNFVEDKEPHCSGAKTLHYSRGGHIIGDPGVSAARGSAQLSSDPAMRSTELQVTPSNKEPLKSGIEHHGPPSDNNSCSGMLSVSSDPMVSTLPTLSHVQSHSSGCTQAALSPKAEGEALVPYEPLHINQLPPSLLLKIFSHLSLNERCLSASLVCKYWRDLCLDFQFWKQLELSSRQQVKDSLLEKIASRCMNITEINISDCLNVTDAGICKLAMNCPGLVKYTAYRCKQLSDVSLISLATHCRFLQKVHVGNQDRLTDKALTQLGSRCRDLRDIHFGQCYKISDEGMVIIAKGCSKLQKIYMQENKLVTNRSVEAFAEHCSELQYVGFMGCSVTSHGVIHLTSLKPLSSLDLRNITELDNQTVIEIVKKCQNLTSLNLCLNRNIDDRCVEVIAKEGRSLKELYLVTCKITDHALIAIGRYSSSIETVDVGWCKEITDQGATLIAQSSKSIRYLGLMRCDQVNESTVEQLVQQYPHITFSTVLQDCKRTLERAYQMGWTPNASSVS